MWNCTLRADSYFFTSDKVIIRLLLALVLNDKLELNKFGEDGDDWYS